MSSQFSPNLTPLIKHNDKKIIFQVFDIEAMNWTKLLCIGFYDGKNYIEFRSMKQFVKYISELKEPLNCFAHFGGKYDFLFLLKECLRSDIAKPIKIIPRGSSMLFLEIKTKHTTHIFRDSSALLPFGLKSITENFGTSTKKGEWDHSKTKGYSKKLAAYMKDDCISLHQSINEFYKWPLIDKAGPAYTVASQAMRIFRTFLKEPIINMGQKKTEFARRAYLGGRTEIFKPICNKGPLYEYDVNSLYPFVMANNMFPSDAGYFTYEYEPQKLGIWHATVTCPSDLYIPCLGIIHNGKYVFPNGRFTGYWTSVELEYAKSLGYKIKYHRGIVFNTKDYLFKEFIESLYNIRMSSPSVSVSNVLAKLIMNSSYGRFGMNLERENITFDLKEGCKEFTEFKIGKQKIALFKEPAELNSFSHTGIAAFVTSYARLHMHKLMMKSPKALYYTDTDSLFTNKKFDSGSKLGELKLVTEWDSACFLLPKTYIAKALNKSKIAMKGFDNKKIQHFTIEDFKSSLEGELHRIKITTEPKFASLKTALAQKKIVTMTKASTKQLKAKYDKRIILKGGIDTKPITLGADNEINSINKQ